MSNSTVSPDAAASSSELIHLDGRTLEGGGQLLRLALSLSSLTGRGIHVTDIRGNRTKGHGRNAKKGGGLKTSHYECARWLAALTGATTEGLEVGSSELTFRPSLDRAVDIDVIIDLLSMQQKQLAEQGKKSPDGERGGGRTERAKGGKKGGGKGKGTIASTPTIEAEKASKPSTSSSSTTPASLLLAAADDSVALDKLLPPEYRNSSLDDPGIQPDRPRCFTIQQKTPGAIFLVLQAMLPYLLFGPFSNPRPSAKDLVDRQDSQHAARNAQSTASAYSIASNFRSSSSTPALAQQPLPLRPPEIRLNIVGGTNVSSAPSFEYAQQVIFPTLENLVGIPFIAAQLSQRGWSSPPSRAGGGGNQLGSVSLRIQPLSSGTPLPAFNIFREPGQENSERYTLKRVDVSIIAHPPALLKELEEELVAEMEHRFRDGGLNGSPVPVRVKLREDSGRRNQIYILAVARIGAPDLKAPSLAAEPAAPQPSIQSQNLNSHSPPQDHPSTYPASDPPTSTPAPPQPKEYLLGRDILLDGRDRPTLQPRDLAKRLARELRDDVASGRLVDEHMQDQLVVFQALAAGRSTVDAGPRAEPTLHTQTARWVAEKILVGLRFDAGGKEAEGAKERGSGVGDRGRSCVGVAFAPGSHVSDGNGTGSGHKLERHESDMRVGDVEKLTLTGEVPRTPP